MLLRSGKNTLDLDTVDQQLQYWKQQVLPHMDKLQFLPRSHPLQQQCRDILQLYQEIIHQHQTLWLDNPYFRQLRTETMLQAVDSKLIPEMMRLYQDFCQCPYPTEFCCRTSLRKITHRCPICLEHFQSGDLAQRCGGSTVHYCHRKCMVQWMRAQTESDDKPSNTCPLCLEPMNQSRLYQTI